MASIWTLQLHSVSVPHRALSYQFELRSESGIRCSYRIWNLRNRCKGFVIRAYSNSVPSNEDNPSKDEAVLVISESKDALVTEHPISGLRETVPSNEDNPSKDEAVLAVSESKDALVTKHPISGLRETVASDKDNLSKDEEVLAISVSKDALVTKHPISRLRETVTSLPLVNFLAKNHPPTNFAIGFFIAATLLIVSVRIYMARKAGNKQPGSVADLVRRGQLKSDRRGISKPLKYDDPFDNPLVKVDKNNSTVEMCGKVYRLAPVTLTREEQNTHQKRRSRAYQWKRPTIFLKEGDSIPPDVDPDTVRWIPSNHPFATTATDISEDLAQNNVYQKHGVPFRIQAEHEALQKKLEALQSDQKFNHLVIDPGTVRNFERPFKSNLNSDDQQADKSSTNGQAGSSKPPPSEAELGSNGSCNSTSEEKQTL